jgi:hypothetical protein
MKALDFVKAVAVTLLIMAADVLVGYVVVTGYVLLVGSGNFNEVSVAAMRIAPWSSRLIGPLIFCAAAYLCARRRPQRNPFLFAAAFSVGYVIVEGISIRMVVGSVVGLFTGIIALSMLAKFLGALAGAYIATRRTDSGARGVMQRGPGVEPSL